ncbi:hypothetical protein AB4099_22065 [Bosea sp. 2KB_26]|uniref:hypothetical protein n=1 Tax=Bosea sp. 2KB_26 TaxID=3237475 RepID=UPI003F931865
MRLAKFFIVIAMLHLPAAQFASASTLELQRAVSAWIWDDGKLRQTYSVDERKRLATALRDYWKSFADRIPRLLPSEDRWLKGELESESIERVAAAMNRREYALHDTFANADACKVAYGDIISDIGGNPQREALKWARSLNCYKNDVRIELENAGLKKRDSYDDDPFHMHFFSLWTQRIIGPVLGSVLDEPNFR